MSVCLRNSGEVAQYRITVWLHFCLKATEKGTVVLGVLIAGPLTKLSSESKQKKSL